MQLSQRVKSSCQATARGSAPPLRAACGRRQQLPVVAAAVVAERSTALPPAIKRVLFDEEQLRDKVAELAQQVRVRASRLLRVQPPVAPAARSPAPAAGAAARCRCLCCQICKDYQGKPLAIIGVLNGAFVFTSGEARWSQPRPSERGSCCTAAARSQQTGAAALPPAAASQSSVLRHTAMLSRPASPSLTLSHSLSPSHTHLLSLSLSHTPAPSDLVREISKEIPDVKVDFMRASSYGAASSSTGAVAIKSKSALSKWNEHHILLVEDIIDSGHTLARLGGLLQEAGAPSVRVVALLDKKGRRRVECFPDYVGWEVRVCEQESQGGAQEREPERARCAQPARLALTLCCARLLPAACTLPITPRHPNTAQCPNEFVVGYGLDYNECFRCLPYVAALKEEAYAGSGH